MGSVTFPVTRPITGPVTSAIAQPDGSSGLAAFALEAETQTYITAAEAALGSSLPTSQKLAFNKFFKGLKDYSLISLITQAQLLGGGIGSAARLINLVNPGTHNLVQTNGTGVITFGSVGTSGQAATTARLASDLTAASLSANDFHFCMMSESTAANSSTPNGCIDAGGIGVSVIGKRSTTLDIAVRAGTTNLAAGASTDTDGDGWFMVVRDNSANFRVEAQGRTLSVATAFSSLPALTMGVCALNNNGTWASTTTVFSFFSVGKAMTSAQSERYYALARTLYEEIRFGAIEVYAAGKSHTIDSSPGIYQANAIIYGATPSAVMAAYSLARAGRTVAIVGGWRDRHIGGMLTGGLGATDLHDTTSVGGLPKYYLDSVKAITGRSDYRFEPRIAEWMFKALLDTSKTGGLSIPVFWSDGVTTVYKSGARITGFSTADGRRYNASYFVDASYEGDLMARSGVTYRIGREAAGSGADAVNGFRGPTITTVGATNHQLLSDDGTQLTVDPFVTLGNPATALLAGVTLKDPAFPADGAADYSEYKDLTLQSSNGTPQTQAFNYRLTVVGTSSQYRRKLFETSAPAGYDTSLYEILFRFNEAATAAAKTITLTGSMVLGQTISGTGQTITDWNAERACTSDWIGQNGSYLEGSYAQRETNWKAHENYLRGFLYAICQEARVQSGIKTAALGFGYDARHYLDPHPNDSLFWPYQLYVRETRRMVGSLIHTGTDINATDATTPTSTKTIAVASYNLDSHYTQRLAHNNGGTWRIWAEGGFENTTTGGTDQRSPLPYEIICPQVAECENLLVTFCISSNHVAFGAIRMETTAMEMGQAAGLAIHCAIRDGNISVQNVDYPTAVTGLRAMLLAAETLSGEVDPVLPQLN